MTLCAAILDYEFQGMMQDITFAVEAIRWGSNDSSIHPKLGGLQSLRPLHGLRAIID